MQFPSPCLPLFLYFYITFLSIGFFIKTLPHKIFWDYIPPNKLLTVTMLNKLRLSVRSWCTCTSLSAVYSLLDSSLSAVYSLPDSSLLDVYSLLDSSLLDVYSLLDSSLSADYSLLDSSLLDVYSLLDSSLLDVYSLLDSSLLDVYSLLDSSLSADYSLLDSCEHYSWQLSTLFLIAINTAPDSIFTCLSCGEQTGGEKFIYLKLVGILSPWQPLVKL
jgi:hypothetical protein